MATPVPATTTIADVIDQTDQGVYRAVSAWHDEFFSDPVNRAAYAAWCETNGLENDLPDLDNGKDECP